MADVLVIIGAGGMGEAIARRTGSGQQEPAGTSGDSMRAMIENSATGRLGTTHDVADAVAFLFGPESTFVTGTDLLVDGGVVASIRTGTAVTKGGSAIRG